MRQHRTDPAAIEAEIARIRSLALDALRRRWRVIFGRPPPAGLSKDLLGRMIAWRLQEQAFGGLDRLGGTGPAQSEQWCCSIGRRRIISGSARNRSSYGLWQISIDERLIMPNRSIDR